MRKPTGDNTLAGYVRQSSADIIPTATLRAAPINAEYNKLRDAFAVSSGHKHDGSTGEGGYIPLIGDVDALNKVSINTSTNQIGVFVEVSNAAVEQLRFSDGAIIPVITNDIDLGTSGLEFKDLYLDGTAHIDTLDVDINGAVAGTFTIGSTLGVTGTTTLSTANITTGVITSVDINSGAIDNVTIGGTTAGAGSFTTLSATGTSTLSTVDINAGAIDGTTIGASSAAPATVTDLTSTGTATLATVDINAGNIDNTVIGASTAVAGSFTTVSTSGQATLATVDINGGNIDGTIIGASATAAITGTTITGSSFVGPLTGNVTGNITGNVTGNLTGNVTGNVTAGSGLSTFNNVTVNGTLDVTGTTIANVTDPTNAQDAATKNYVDTEVSALVDSSPSALNTLNELAAAINDDASFSTTITNSIATKLPLAGGTMSGAIAMGTSKITGLGDPTANQDGATKNYVDTTALLKSGGTMASAIAMGNNKITGLGTPTANTDAATKTYVDSIAGSNTAAAASATQAATSATNAATSATNSANSATSAATSATNAANSYDSFDDRYLGAKSSAPTVDNDGDALITGALYFNTTSNIMFVRSSAGGWQAAGSSVNGTSGRNTYTATAGQTTFSATYDVGYVDVFLNGVKLLVGTDVTATSGSTVVLATGATVGDIIDIVGYGTFQLADHYSKTASDARFLGLAGGTMTGDIDGNGNKVLFGNVYSQVSDLPSASTYHGMFAHVHATGKGYFAHAGNWVVLANDTEKLNLSGGTMTGNLDVGGSIEFDSLSGTGSVSITDILDEDNMASNSATALATQQSIKAYTDTAVANLVDSSPASLDTLNELAAALGDDASFSTTITNSIATKLPLAGGTMTGTIAGFESTGIDDNASSTAMTIDSSGNLLVGKTSVDTDLTGIELRANNLLASTRASAECLFLNRKTSDGDIAKFAKDGTTVGSIGTGFGQLVIGQSNTSVILDNSNTRFAPSNADGSGNDGNTTLGWSNRRWSDLYLSGSIANPSGNLTLDASGDITLDADGGDIRFKDGGIEVGAIVMDDGSNTLIVQATQNDADIKFTGKDNNSGITALTLDMSAAGDAIFNSDVVLGSTGKLRSNGDDDSYLQFNQANTLRAVIGDSTRMIINPNDTVFNEDSIDVDFRVESNGQSSMLFVDGGNDRVGVGTSSPNTDFEVRKGVTSAIRVSGGSNTNYKTEIGYDNSTGPYIKSGSSGIQSLQFYVDNTSLALTLAANDVATFTSDVNATNFNSTSDANLKTNVETLTGSLDAVKSLRGVSFDWLENGGSEIGVIAQEVEDVLPDVVNTNEDGIKSVKYGNMVAVLIEAMKEQQAQIDELKSQLNS